MVFASSSFAQQVKGLVRESVLKATSVGFRPLKFSFSKDKSRGGGIDFIEQELLEFSVVGVPANAEALLFQCPQILRSDLGFGFDRHFSTPPSGE